MNNIKPVEVGSLEIGTEIPKICVSITGRTRSEILSQAREILKARPDLVEWRADFYEDVMDYACVWEVCIALSGILGQIPLLFTFRTEREGGNRQIPVKDYMSLNRTVSEVEEVALIDVEVFMDCPKMRDLISAIRKNGKAVIGSHHRFDETPSRPEMVSILKTLEESGADIVKMAVMPKNEADVENLISATREAVHDVLSHPAVTMSMGKLGEKSRTTGEQFGSCVTFGCVGESSAPGQIPVEILRKEIKNFHDSLCTVNKTLI